MSEFLRQLWAFCRPHRRHLVWSIIAGLVSALGTTLLLLAVKIVVDVAFGDVQGTAKLADIIEKVRKIAPFLAGMVQQGLDSLKNAAANPSGKWLILSLIPIAMALRGFGTFLSFYFSYRAAGSTLHDVRVAVFRKLQNLSLDFFNTARTGDLVSRIGNDANVMHTSLHLAISSLVKDPFNVLFIVYYLIVAQPRLTALSLGVFPLVVLPILLFGRRVRKSARAAQTFTSELADQMQESFTGARVVKAFNLESHVTARFVATSEKILRQTLRMVRSHELPGPIIELFGAIGVVALLAYLLTHRELRIEPGDFVSFMGALFSLYQPVKNLGRVWSQLEQGRAAGERVFGILHQTSSVVEPAKPVPLDARNQTVVFENVSFRYGEKQVLTDISIRLQPGTTTALVGASGSGKTTLTNLLLRFYDPTSGGIRIGDTDIRKVSTSELRAQVAIVTQDTILFNETIRENLRLARPGVSDREIEAAATRAHATEFISSRTEGFDSMIGEKGVSLSGGQRQRLAIARAILKDTPILILDEATSALDSETERAVQASLDELRSGRTTLCVAHRLSTIQNADQIVVLEEGRVMEIGRHEELLKRNGVYARLHAVQFAAHTTDPA